MLIIRIWENENSNNARIMASAFLMPTISYPILYTYRNEKDARMANIINMNTSELKSPYRSEKGSR
jgi:hypothetical protein